MTAISNTADVSKTEAGSESGLMVCRYNTIRNSMYPSWKVRSISPKKSYLYSLSIADLIYGTTKLMGFKKTKKKTTLMK